MTILEDLNWRYATKKFDDAKKVSAEDLELIKEAIRLSPSSYGLQPYEILIITDQKTKASLLPHSYNQNQVVDCSHLFIFCHYIDIPDIIVDTYIDNISATRGIETEKLKGFQNAIKGSISGRSPENLQNWASKQCYLALANLLNACAHLRIDTCPMEGFVPEAYSKALNLSKLNLYPCLLAPIGYRSDDDSNAFLKKVRKKTELMFTVL